MPRQAPVHRPVPAPRGRWPVTRGHCRSPSCLGLRELWALCGWRLWRPPFPHPLPPPPVGRPYGTWSIGCLSDKPFVIIKFLLLLNVNAFFIIGLGTPAPLMDITLRQDWSATLYIGTWMYYDRYYAMRDVKDLGQQMGYISPKWNWPKEAICFLLVPVFDHGIWDLFLFLNAF